MICNRSWLHCIQEFQELGLIGLRCRKWLSPYLGLAILLAIHMPFTASAGSQAIKTCALAGLLVILLVYQVLGELILQRRECPVIDTVQSKHQPFAGILSALPLTRFGQ
jgi:hypothetical protein